MLDRVSYHACIRYLDRVLGLPVDEWLLGMEHLGENLKAKHCCERAGLPVDVVRATILIPCVANAIRCRLTVALKHDRFVYIITNGLVATILTPTIYMRTMGSRYGQPRPDKSKKRRKERRRLLALAEVE